MKKVLVASLRGPALDWAVHQAEGLGGMFLPVRWSVKWEYAGQLFDKMNMCLVGAPMERRAFIPFTPIEAMGPTPTIAICRCYVLAKMGHELEVPAEYFDAES